MPLTNTQYQEILRRYDQLQFEDARIRAERHTEVYEAIPQIKALDEEIARISASYARAAICKDDGLNIREYRMSIREIEELKRILLKSGGYAADYLDPVYHCPDCRDTGFIGDRKCHCFTQAVVDLLYTQSDIRSRLQEENFDTFRPDYYSEDKDPRYGISPRENIEKVLAVCHAFIRDIDEKHGNLLLYGSTGVGKTFLANCIAKELMDSGHIVVYLTADQLVEVFESSTFGHEGPSCGPCTDESIRECDLLIIDDLGTEMNNTFVTSRLFSCLNDRLLRRRSVLISTNLSVEILGKTYSERIYSRIISNYQIIPVIGQDIRVRKALALST